MGGKNEHEMSISEQLICECEDVYSKLTKNQPTTRQPVKCSADELMALWTSTDRTVHNREQGLHANLDSLDAFAARGAAARGGRFTETGTTVGECKLFATLHTLRLIEPEVLRPHARLDEFYEGFAEHPATRSVLERGGAMPGPFEQYFVRGDS